ncbi:Semaphorin-4D [Apodemus speciosus]|uniref:Semaphorin-4D n=1 Tax=Apodemus speciosus TaxID=105296 RepID=A0ABQ0FG19_APOSI
MMKPLSTGYAAGACTTYRQEAVMQKELDKEPTREGPADVRFIWEKNRHVLDTCVPMQTHALSDGRAHALSWLRDTIQETTEYSCSVLSSAGNQTSKVHITVMRREALQQEKWSQELAAWRAVAGEHDRLMQGWRKAWESCSKDTF